MSDKIAVQIIVGNKWKIGHDHEPGRLMNWENRRKSRKKNKKEREVSIFMISFSIVSSMRLKNKGHFLNVNLLRVYESKTRYSALPPGNVEKCWGMLRDAGLSEKKQCLWLCIMCMLHVIASNDVGLRCPCLTEVTHRLHSDRNQGWEWGMGSLEKEL